MLPHEKTLVERLKNEPFALIGINTDADKDDYRKKAEEQDVSWRSAWDGSTRGPWCTAWGVTSFPTIYVLDAKGVIRYRNVRNENMDEAVDALLAELKAGRGAEAPARPAKPAKEGSQKPADEKPDKSAGDKPSGDKPAADKPAGDKSDKPAPKPADKDASLPIGLRIGQRAPEFSAKDTEGVEFKLSDYRGKVVAVDFWGFW